MMTPEGENSPQRGIYDGFEAYRTVSSATTQSALKEGLVVVDTNVLLNLYRYDDAAREDLFKVLGALGDHLFVPHQVIAELWRNRENVLRDRLNIAELAVGRLAELSDEPRKVVREWANRLAISDDLRTTLLGVLSTAFDKVSGVVEASAGVAEEAEAHDTSNDPVLQRLEMLLAGKVGHPLSDEEHRNVVKEGLRRVEDKIPPGFKDRKKSGDDAAGDYLVWVQALREARRRGVKTMTFVTGDTAGDDWWRRERGELRGPRIELHTEARDEADAQLLLLRPQSLVFHTHQALNVDIEADTVSSIQRADELAIPHSRPSWTAHIVNDFLSWLKAEGPVQYDTIMAAVRDGGFVSRDRVYELGRYEPTRTLRGFTRPVRRIMQQMQDNGLLDDNVQDALETVYDPGYSYVQASGFRVPDEFVALVRTSEGASTTKDVLDKLRLATDVAIPKDVLDKLRLATDVSDADESSDEDPESEAEGDE